VFVRGTDNQLWHKWWDGSGWRGWEALGGVLASGPDATSCAAMHLDVVVLGNDGQLWRKGYNGTSWGQWTPIAGGWTSKAGIVCRPTTTLIDVFGRGTDGQMWTTSIAAS
jgi:hypothetical protein